MSVFHVIVIFAITDVRHDAALATLSIQDISKL